MVMEKAVANCTIVLRRKA